MINSLLFNFFIGTCLASHAGVVCDRYGQADFIFSRSRCSHCLHQLTLLDELPLISYFLLKGRCRYCQNAIPRTLLIIELIGGLSFIDLNLLAAANLYELLFRFFLLTIALFDYQEQEFPTPFLLPLAFIACLQLQEPLFNLIMALPAVIVMLILVLKNKLGSGDLLIYLLLTLYYGSMTSSLIFLIAAILFIIIYLFSQEKQAVAFVPHIYAALIIVQLS
jgi:leader peptidase (prepilin peptidase)/N-methyltransferase